LLSRRFPVKDSCLLRRKSIIALLIACGKMREYSLHFKLQWNDCNFLPQRFIQQAPNPGGAYRI